MKKIIFTLLLSSLSVLTSLAQTFEQRCDVNNDGVVNISDVNAVISCMCGIKITSITLNYTSASIYAGEKLTLTATILPEYAGDITLIWSSSNESVVTVDGGVVTALAPGTATITATANDAGKAYTTCAITVNNDPTDQHEYVDLGLPSKTLWAKHNVGANSPEEYGEYFAWGEISEKGKFSLSTYKWCCGSYNGMNKYNTLPAYGTVDNKIELESADDAATANWGSHWQMPSYDQITELYDSCYTTTEWTTANGVYGVKITSISNGNSIFLPAATFRYDTFYGQSSLAYYWSRSLDSNECYNACNLYFSSSGIGNSKNVRWNGFPVRPVRVQK